MILGVGLVVGGTAAATTPGAAILGWGRRRGAVLVVIASGGIEMLALAVVVQGAIAALERNQLCFGQHVILAQHGLQMVDVVDGDAARGS